MKRKLNFFIRLALILLLPAMVWSCNKDPFRVDVSSNKVTISITRFEDMLFSSDPSKIEQLIPKWDKELGIFFRHFCQITGIGSIDNPEFATRFKAFASSYHNYLIYSRVKDIFPDLSKLNTELNDAFSYYHHYFPDMPIPRVVTYVSGFNQSAITDDSLLAVGLDKYLGRNEELYRQLGIYNYLLTNMYPEKIASDCVSFWGETEFPFNDSINNLITNMIYRGKLLYFTSALLPEQSDSVKWGFTGSDLKYFNTAEKAMWAFLVEHKLLFSTDKLTINKYVLEGPFTKDFGRGSPARAAVWIGYRIVESYMQKNRNLTLAQLMEEDDYMKILNQSAYNP
ncbi:MAG: hypothetical protein JXA72_13895 [Bacteroidales bacterium]|nr:hypothetical protein [Bacteroidales bacterium]